MVEVGWSTLGRFPYDLSRTLPTSASRERREFALSECFVATSGLFILTRGRPDGLWQVWSCSAAIDDPDYSRIFEEEDQAPVSGDQAAARVQAVVEEAVRDLAEVVVPYLHERVEWEREDFRTARQAALERLGLVQAEFDARYYPVGAGRRPTGMCGWVPSARERHRQLGDRPDAGRSCSLPVECRSGPLGRSTREDALSACAGPRRSVRDAGGSRRARRLREGKEEPERARRGGVPAPAHASGPSGGTGPCQDDAESDPGGGGQSWPVPSWAKGGLEWRWETPVGRCTVRTHVIVHGWLCQVTYGHALGVVGSEPRYLETNAALMSWLGISRLTTWSLPPRPTRRQP